MYFADDHTIFFLHLNISMTNKNEVYKTLSQFSMLYNSTLFFFCLFIYLFNFISLKLIRSFFIVNLFAFGISFL